jgi:hypothetical protein
MRLSHLGTLRDNEEVETVDREWFEIDRRGRAI